MRALGFRFRRLGLPAASAALALAVAAVALADVSIYRNDFSARSEFGEISKAGGKKCEKRYRKKSETMRVNFDRGDQGCSFAIPVEGDGAEPDHVFQASGKVSPDTAKQVKDKAYVGVWLRVGGGNGYELRVFPTTDEFELRREPAGGGGGFPATGTSGEIKGIGERNKLRLRAAGAQVKAFVNGTLLTTETDSNPGELQGAKIEFTLGSTASGDRKVEGVFDDLKLGVPSS
jgi:hypothetical protein